MKTNDEVTSLVHDVEMRIERDNETATLLYIVKLCKETSQRDNMYFFRIELMKEAVMVEIYDARKDLEVFHKTARFGESPSKLEALEKKIKELLEEVKGEMK